MMDAQQKLIDEMHSKGVTAVRFYWGPVEDDMWFQHDLEMPAFPGDTIDVPGYKVGNV